MKKNLSKLFALALALIMAMALAVPAMATTVNITGGNENATYDAYQIMTLNQSGENYAYTVNSEWTTVLTDYFEISTENKTAAAVNNEIVAEIAKYVKDSDEIRALAEELFDNIGGKTKAVDGQASGFDVANGYYLIVETTTVGDDEVKSLVMLDTANNTSVDIQSKNDSVTVDKDITGAADDNDVGDYDIGDSVPFTITGTIPKNIDQYTTYTYTITDTMTGGLELNAATIEVTVGGIKVYDATEVGFVADKDVSVNATQAGLTVTLGNYILAHKDTLAGATAAKVVVEYSATLTADAKIDSADGGNKNNVEITYQNDPYTTSSGTTTPDEVEVKTFDIDIFKYYNVKTEVEGEPVITKTALPGAEFELTNSEGEYASVTGDNGNYIFAGWVNESGINTKMTSPENGYIALDGLKSGIYTLRETDAPDGYNLLNKAITVKITDAGVVTISGQDSSEVTLGTDGVIEVLNQSGTELPSTGGMGTTIFYTLGGLLAVGAAVLLVTKKRVHDAEK